MDEQLPPWTAAAVGTLKQDVECATVLIHTNISFFILLSEWSMNPMSHDFGNPFSLF